MDIRLHEACLDGDVAALRHLLQEDALVLNRAAASASVTDGPLHTAALLGHAELVMEILRLKPDLARERNARGSYPLHLACANGHRRVVEELLKVDTDLCHLRDGDGSHVPIHTAVMKGRVEVVQVLIEANKESAQALTSHGESILHLGVRSSSLEVLRLLVERLDLGGDEQFLNLQDERGNTALHLATARKQAQMVEFLVGKSGVHVNAANQRGATALDVLLELPCEHGDLSLGNILFSAGGRTTTSRGSPALPLNGVRGINSPLVEPRRKITTRQRRWPLRSPANAGDEWVNYTPNTIMLVAVLIATVTFQAGIQPPGGFRQDDKLTGSMTTSYHAGEAVLSQDLRFIFFMAFDLVALFASVTIILLLMCVVPYRRRKLTKVLVWIMWIAVFSTALAFTFGALSVSHNRGMMFIYFCVWLGVLAITVLWLVLRFVIYLGRMLLPKEKPGRTGPARNWAGESIVQLTSGPSSSSG